MEEKKEYYGYYGRMLEKDGWKTVRNWWESLEENRGERARLRRCEAPLQVILQNGFHRLLNELGWHHQKRVHGLAMVAGILSRVKENSYSKGVRFGHQLSQSKEGSEKPRVSELRFNQLMKVRTQPPEEFYRHLMRVVDLLDKKVNVLSLAEFILEWDRENRKNIQKEPDKRLQFLLAQDYYKQISKQS